MAALRVKLECALLGNAQLLACIVYLPASGLGIC